MTRLSIQPSLMILVLSIASLVVVQSASVGETPSQSEDIETQPVAPIELKVRVRTPKSEIDPFERVTTKAISWDPHKTAVVVCDMWNYHWCKNATDRVAEMAPRMNKTIKGLRNKGVLVIHCPSSTLDAYKDHPGRKLAQSAPKVKTKTPLLGWCHLDKKLEGELPIDDSDGGCDSDPEAQKKYRQRLIDNGLNPDQPWTSQIDTIDILPGDAITDSAEAYYLMRARGIENVLVMGVHTNMCVLGRPFSIRQMVNQGQNVVLVRDLTDSMYNPKSKPYVSHFSGTDLVIEHIERHWCPTITSDQVLGGEPFRFAGDKRPHLVAVLGEPEYQTTETVPKFVDKFLRKDFRVSYVFWKGSKSNRLPGIEVLDDADVALISVRRCTPPKEQLDVVRRYVASGKPLVAIRTSSHAFCLRGKKPAQGNEEWPEFDAEVLGGNYTGHAATSGKNAARTTTVVISSENASHPILAGVDPGPWVSESWLYFCQPLGKKTMPLLFARLGEDKEPEPVAWTNTSKSGGRVFYTSLGAAGDFDEPRFQRLLLNGIHWAVELPSKAR